MNGYQLIQALAERTDGAWKPSSGAMYPALAQLEDEGLIEQITSEDRKAYRLTEAGTAEVEAAGDKPRPWEEFNQQAAEAAGDGLLHQAQALAMAVQAVAQSGDEATRAKAGELLDQTRKSLYRLLAEDQD